MFGRSEQNTAGRQISVSADGAPEWKLGGITIDWSGITAESADLTLEDGTIVRSGSKYIRYGTVLVENASSELYEPAGSGDTLENGSTVVLNETLIQDPDGLVNADNHGAIEGGRVWQDRLLVDDSDTPSLADLLAALPRLQMVIN